MIKLAINEFTLIDSLQRAAEHPETWAHPPQQALDKIKPGYFVKVGVTHRDLPSERLWGIVKDNTGADITIEINQDLVCSQHHGLCDKDVLLVQQRHIFGIVDNRGASIWQADPMPRTGREDACEDSD